MKRIIATPAIRAAAMAEQFSREIGLPPGNMWVPGIARGIERELKERPADEVERMFRFRLGLNQESEVDSE